MTKSWYMLDVLRVLVKYGNEDAMRQIVKIDAMMMWRENKLLKASILKQSTK